MPFNSSLTFSGFEISDVLGINDRDFSITYGLYFSAEWLEPRLNLSTELWGEGVVATEQDLVPGGVPRFQNMFLIPPGFVFGCQRELWSLKKIKKLFIDNKFLINLFSKP